MCWPGRKSQLSGRQAKKAPPRSAWPQHITYIPMFIHVGKARSNGRRADPRMPR